MFHKISFFVLGIIVGAIIVNLAAGQRLETLYWEKESLKVDLYEITERMRKIESQKNLNEKRLVQEIVVELETKENPFIKLGLKQKVNEITEKLIGEDIDTLSHYLVYKLLDERTLEMESKHYRLDVNMIIVSKTITYYISVSLVDDTDNNNTI